MKKKVVYSIVIVLSLLIVSFLVITGINAYRFFNNYPPIVVLKHTVRENGSGYIEQYCSLGYEFIYTESKGYNFHLGCHSVDKYVIDNSSKIVYEPSENEGECSVEKSRLFETTDRIYYVSCRNANNMFYVDGDKKEPINFALSKKHIELSDLRKAGYEITVEEKERDPLLDKIKDKLDNN